MTLSDSFFNMMQYSNEVTLNANEVAGKYKDQLTKLQEIAEEISSFANEISESLPIETANRLITISNSVVDLSSENILNFTAFMEFTKWNFEKLQKTMETYQQSIEK